MTHFGFRPHRVATDATPSKGELVQSVGSRIVECLSAVVGMSWSIYRIVSERGQHLAPGRNRSNPITHRKQTEGPGYRLYLEDCRYICQRTVARMCRDN